MFDGSCPTQPPYHYRVRWHYPARCPKRRLPGFGLQEGSRYDRCRRFRVIRYVNYRSVPDESYNVHHTGAYTVGKISEEERFDVVRHSCPGPGACGGMFT